MTNNKPVVVRFAPSPTGGLHIGGVRTALYNYLFAKRHGGKFLLRIEDTDQTRFVEGAEKYIIDTLRWCGIMPDEGISPEGTATYRQSEKNYNMAVNALMEMGLAYRAFDTPEELDVIRKKFEGTRHVWSYNAYTRETMKNDLTLSHEDVQARLERGDPYVIRMKVPKNVEVVIDDAVRGKVVINTKEVDDKVLVKSDGLPSYHLANVVDDHRQGVTHVLRGEEWLPSAPLHVLLYDAFRWDKPVFAHLPLMLNPDGKGKLSKRKALEYGFSVFPLTWSVDDAEGNPVEMKGYKELGYEKDAFLNMLAMYGWTPSNEISTLEEMAAEFDLNHVHKNGSRFNIEKANWFNAEYLKKVPPADLLVGLDTFGKQYGNDKLERIVAVASERSTFRHEISENAKMFFVPPTYEHGASDKFLASCEWMPDHLVLISITNADEENSANFKHMVSLLAAKVDAKPGLIMSELRYALTAGKHGPELWKVISIFGIGEVMMRLKAYLEFKTEEVTK